MQSIRIILTALAICACSSATAQDNTAWPDGFVHAGDVVTGLVEEIRYFGGDNFVGERIDGYEAPACILTREAADALAEAQASLTPFGLGLKVLDCYRPVMAVEHFMRWADDESDTRMKADYYPDLPKEELFARGYIASRSGHSRGSTVDLTIIDGNSGEDLDMGTGYDLFSTQSWPTAPNLSPQQRANRMLLQTLMVNSGFSPYEQEWWHFTLADEPFPETYFEFPVR